MVGDTLPTSMGRVASHLAPLVPSLPMFIWSLGSGGSPGPSPGEMLSPW